MVSFTLPPIFVAMILTILTMMVIFTVLKISYNSKRRSEKLMMKASHDIHSLERELKKMQYFDNNRKLKTRGSFIKANRGKLIRKIKDSGMLDPPKEIEYPVSKKCPECNYSSLLKATECSHCGYLWS